MPHFVTRLQKVPSTRLGGRFCCLLGLIPMMIFLAACGDSPDPGTSSTPDQATPTAASAATETPLPTVAPTPTQEPTPTAAPDKDGDSIPDVDDNCISKDNSNQADGDGDGVGDACDDCPADADNDIDDDGFCGNEDNCPTDANENQADEDNDGAGDVCDVCPSDPADDVDDDGTCGDIDNCPTTSNADQLDSDADLLGNACDSCPSNYNPLQENADGDAFGDVCDVCQQDPANDIDLDGACADQDNCPLDTNSNQMDRDGDGAGDVCDPCPDHNPDQNEDGTCGTIDTPNGQPGSKDAPFFIFGTNPDNGYQKVPLSLTGKIFFSQPYTGLSSAVHVRLVSEHGNASDLSVSLTSDKTEARFYPTLQAETDYCILTKVDYQSTIDARWPLEYSACFTTRVPCGVPINVGYDTQVEKLGMTPGVVKALQASIEYYGNDYPIALVFTDKIRTDTFPFSNLEAVLGAYIESTSGNYLRNDGYTSTFNGCSISGGGALNCAGDMAIFPLYVGSTGVNLYVSDALITGTVQSSGNIQTMSKFTLSGVVTKDNILRVEAETGVTGIANQINLDVDLDGDGENDAATFQASTSPQVLSLVDTECTQ